MTDSQHPLYQKGYQRGRAKTEQELAEYRKTELYAERWNKVFLTMLPTAMQVEGWTIDKEKVVNSEQRIRLAKLWTDRVVQTMK